MAPPPVVQKLYESRQARAFDPDELTQVTRVLGFYSDLQSLNSEDAITWSYFGPLLAETPATRAAFLNWLLEQVGLGAFASSTTCQLDLWRRIPHPDRWTSSRGPELDVVLDGDRAVAFCEAKWRSKEATNQGISGTKSQLQLRRDFLGSMGKRVYEDRVLVVCGIVLDDPLAEVTPPDRHGVHTVSINWDALASYSRHPVADEFARYLDWKRHSCRRGARLRLLPELRHLSCPSRACDAVEVLIPGGTRSAGYFAATAATRETQSSHVQNSAAARFSLQGKVTHVVDGDTLMSASAVVMSACASSASTLLTSAPVSARMLRELRSASPVVGVFVS